MEDHGPNCWAEHMDCAQTRIASLERQVQELLGVSEDQSSVPIVQVLERQKLRIEFLEQTVTRLSAALQKAEGG